MVQADTSTKLNRMGNYLSNSYNPYQPLSLSGHHRTKYYPTMFIIIFLLLYALFPTFFVVMIH